MATGDRGGRFKHRGFTDGLMGAYTHYFNINPGKSAAGYLRSLQKLGRVA